MHEGVPRISGERLIVQRLLVVVPVLDVQRTGRRDVVDVRKMQLHGFDRPES